MSATSNTDTYANPEQDRPDYEIVIIGAGISGLGMAVALQEAGFDDFVMFERASDIGGVWRDSRYPGVAVDIPSYAYQFHYFPKPDWSHMYPRGEEVKAYLDEFVEHFGLRRHVRFDHAVTARYWNEGRHVWELTVCGHVVRARWVISAIGNFVMPRKPAIDGVEDFGGTLLYSTRWDESFDLQGKRIAIIGTGASAVQMVPEIAAKAAHLDVYQRTPIWVVPKVNPRIHPAAQRLFRRHPAIQAALGQKLRAVMEWLLIGGVLKYEQPATRRTVHGLTWMLREIFYRRQVPDPQLRARLTPKYGFGCKRPSLSSSYLRSFCEPHVDLICDPIDRITATGIRTVDGIDRPVDAIALATGFHLAYEPEVYRAEPVRGRRGFDLAACFASERARSYEGVSIPGLPNHPFIYGPYGGTGGTYHDVVRMASIHIIRVIGEARRRGATSAEVTEDAAERWTATMRERVAHSLFNLNNCQIANSFYFDRYGDVAFIRPTSCDEAVAAQKQFSFDDYIFSTITSPSDAVTG